MDNLKGLVGWLIFTAILWPTWDSSISQMIRLMEPVASETSGRHPTPRLMLFLAGAYTACRVALLMCLSMLLLYCVMTCFQCVLPLLAPVSQIRTMADWLFDESVLFDPLLPTYLAFHIAVFLGVLFVAVMFACISVSDKELAKADAVRSVVAREALTMACVSVVAYLGMLLHVATRS